MNTQAIANALATRFGTVTATNGTATETVVATADLPDNVSTLALLVYPPTATLEIGTSARRNDLYTFPVLLLRDPPANVPGRTRWLYAWYDAIHDKIATGGMQLGLGSYVSIAEPVALRAEIDGEKYGSSDGTYGTFDVVELTVEVRVNEHVTVVV